MLWVLGCVLDWVGDEITARTGLAAVRVPLDRTSGTQEVTLDVPGYLQTNSYGCGAVAAVMIVRHFHPRKAFGAVYDTVAPDSDLGTSTTRARRGLRACGIDVASRHRLTFRGLCKAIEDDRPVMIVIRNPGSSTAHWVVVYGYGKRPDRLYVAGNNWPWIGTNQIPRREFESIWDPKGNGLICCKAKRRPIARRVKTSFHK